VVSHVQPPVTGDDVQDEGVKLSEQNSQELETIRILDVMLLFEVKKPIKKGILQLADRVQEEGGFSKESFLVQEEVQEIDVSQEGKEENLKQVLESIFLSLKDKLNKEKECLGTMYEVQSYLKKKKEEL